MSPRKSRNRIPEWVVEIKYKRKRRKLALGPYHCPRCRREELGIQADKKEKEVAAICECGLTHSLTYVPYYEPIGYYNKLVDQLRK